MDMLFVHSGFIISSVVIAAMLFGYKYVLQAFGVIVVPDDSIGVVTKKFVIFGSQRSLPDGKIIALNGEAGYQADTLAPGLHVGLWPWQYSVDLVKFVVIPPGKMGCVEACDGAAVRSGRIVAKQVNCDKFQDARMFLQNGGERGPQIDVIPPGTYRINTLLFKVTMRDVVTIQQGQIGVVEALDGEPLDSGRIIARHVDCDSFQDGQAFLDAGGQRGPQMSIVSPGTYRINPLLFGIEMANAVDIPQDKIGIVTTREGKPLKDGEIAGSTVDGHNMFQDPQAFVQAGGWKGMQEEVLLSGRYFINPRFATVEIRDMIEVPIAHVGVVVSFVGREGKDVTGESFKHGNLVSKGEKGCVIRPLDPGRYPINPFTHKVCCVPTANVVLNWANNKTEAHKLDANLCTITVRSKDGFKFNLDVSQIIHVPSNDAPKVIARFGDMSALVTQVLEPLIGNYFRNAAQDADIIDFLKERTARQDAAKAAIAKALEEYNVCAVDTLIGDISPPEELMKTLTDRKLAEQEQITFDTQREAQVRRQELEQATAMADTQRSVVDAERQVSISKFTADASIAAAKGSSEAKTINADADAKVLKLVGEAEAAKVQAIGEAEAAVIKQKIESMDAGNYALVQVANALAQAGVKLVPDIVAGGGAGKSGSLVDVLLAGLVRDQANGKAVNVAPAATTGTAPAEQGAATA